MLEPDFRDDLEAVLEALPTRAADADVLGHHRPGGRSAGAPLPDAARCGSTPAARRAGDVASQARRGGAAAIARRRSSTCCGCTRRRRRIVFCGRREAVAQLAQRLAARGFAVVALSGALSQRSRSAALAAMRDGRARVCVATDLAARGIDLPGLELVLHADLPASAELLLHRSGRTGRAGRGGLAIAGGAAGAAAPGRGAGGAGRAGDRLGAAAGPRRGAGPRPGADAGRAGARRRRRAPATPCWLPACWPRTDRSGSPSPTGGCGAPAGRCRRIWAPRAARGGPAAASGWRGAPTAGRHAGCPIPSPGPAARAEAAPPPPPLRRGAEPLCWPGRGPGDPCAIRPGRSFGTR